jgi:hypothetical protein
MASPNGKPHSPVQVVRLARAQVEELFGKQVESVLGVARNDDDGWTVTLEIVELARIPDTTTVLGSYEATLDADGDLVEAKRTGRYSRNQTDAQRGGNDS